MTGVVLCGGQSTRMRQDKGLMRISGSTWAEAAARKLHSMSLPVVCSVAQHNLYAYQAVFQTNELIADDAALSVGGPLKGILSVHRQLPSEDLLVLAVDMPAMTSELLRRLFEVAGVGSFEAYVFQNGLQVEPLCGVYSAAGLHRIMTKVQTGTFPRFSMHHVLDVLHTKFIQLPDADAKYFFNYNTPDDLSFLYM